MKDPRQMTIIARIDTQASSYEALDEALRLAGRIPDVTLHIAAIPERGTKLVGVAPVAERAKIAKEAVVHAVTERMREGKVQDGMNLSLEVLEGEPGAALSALSAAVDADMVVVATERGGVVRDFFFGTLEDKLVRNGVCPVLVVPTTGAERVPEIDAPRSRAESGALMKPPTRQATVPRNVSAEENLPLTMGLEP